MRLFSLLSIIVVFFCSSCSKDDEIATTTTTFPSNQEISGTALYDSDGDGTVDAPAENAIVYLGDYGEVSPLLDIYPPPRPDTMGPAFENVLWAYVQSDGSYTIGGVPVFERKVLVINYLPVAEASVRGYDTTPDGDDFEEVSTNHFINVWIEEDEIDDGNYFEFTIFQETANKISGSLVFDHDSDGNYDQPPLFSRPVRLYVRNGTPDFINDVYIKEVRTDQMGNFIFENVPEGEYYLYMIFDDFSEIEYSNDDSPDADPLSGDDHYIYVDVTSGEVDSDNNFYLVPAFHLITGSVMEDIDNDGVGDVPLANVQLEIYERDMNGDPVSGSLLGVSFSPDFVFRIPGGAEYVVVLPDIPGYECVASGDNSSEPGEPAGNDCGMIPANMPIAKMVDSDNNFIVRKE